MPFSLGVGLKYLLYVSGFLNIIGKGRKALAVYPASY